jgi:hypothetical protein
LSISISFYLCAIFITLVIFHPLKKFFGTGGFNNLIVKSVCSLSVKEVRDGSFSKSLYEEDPTSNQNQKNSHDDLSDEDFSEWLRGFIDAEGNFFIQVFEDRLKFLFTLCLHKDEAPLIKYVAQRLGVGNLYVNEKNVNYSISRKDHLLKIFNILDKESLNTSKNLNYIAFRQAYDLYFNRESTVTKELREKIINLKSQMNKNRVEFKQPEGHSIRITRYWLLGFLEGDGFFSVNQSDYTLKFGISQACYELNVLEEIKKFLLNLPGEYSVKRKNSEVINLKTYNQAKGRDHKPMSTMIISQSSYIINVLIPFLDTLNWLSKKEQDYKDWKLIINIISQGKHFTDEGKELISLISKEMNNYRLSTSLASQEEAKGLDNEAHFSNLKEDNVRERVLKLLSDPSNYEVQPDGRVLIKSTGTYFKGRGNVGVKVLDDKGVLVYKFNSIKDCALFFNVHSRTINRRLNNGNFVEFNGKNLIFKREIIDDL